jgi:hypothetical protein
VGAKHKIDVEGNTDPCRILSLHQLHNHYESTRKRLKFIEDMEGPSKCANFLQELKDSHTRQKHVPRIRRAPGTYLSDSEDSEPAEEPVAEKEKEVETAEAILARAVAIKTATATAPAAKKAAAQLIEAKK